MSSSFETTQRFFRPLDAGRARRNYRRVQVGRLLNVVRNAVVVAGVTLGAFAAYRHIQSGAQFAVKHIVVDGVVHTPRAALDSVTRQYVGLNLFKIDIARVRRDLGALPWVRHVDIEEKVPDTLRIRIAERAPVALVDNGGSLGYVDEQGVAFASLSPTVGDADLPVITNAITPPDLKRSVQLLHDVRVGDPQLYARISEVSPIAPSGFAIFDRELGALVYANADDISAKWRDLRAILASENLGRGAIEYADLRFDGRVIVKPIGTVAAMPPLSENGGVAAALRKELHHAED